MEGLLIAELWPAEGGYGVTHVPSGGTLSTARTLAKTEDEARQRAARFWSLLTEQQREVWRREVTTSALRHATPAAAIFAVRGLSLIIAHAILGLSHNTNNTRPTVSNENRTKEMTDYLEAIMNAGYSRVTGGVPAAKSEELEAAFAKVRNADNWKYPVDATIPVIDLLDTVQAIAHFTGSESYVANVGQGLVRVYAPGYYQTIGA